MLADQLKGVFLLMLAYLAGSVLAGILDIGIPGAIFGLLFCLVAMLVWPPFQTAMRPGANIMLALIPLCLVPLLVRMVVVLDFGTLAIWLAIAVVAVSALFGVVAVGVIARFFLRTEDRP